MKKGKERQKKGKDEERLSVQDTSQDLEDF